MKKSPYLEHEYRLPDVIAALQIMGSYCWASRKVENWAEKLGSPSSSDNWSDVFRQHPEFFRLNENGWASLRWRHGYDRNYDAKKEREVNDVELSELSDPEKEELTRRPLSAEQIEALINTAIKLHNRAIAHAQENRWLMPLLFGLLGIILGAVLQGGTEVIKMHNKRMQTDQSARYARTLAADARRCNLSNNRSRSQNYQIDVGVCSPFSCSLSPVANLFCTRT